MPTRCSLLCLQHFGAPSAAHLLIRFSPHSHQRGLSVDALSALSPRQRFDAIKHHKCSFVKNFFAHRGDKFGETILLLLAQRAGSFFVRKIPYPAVKPDRVLIQIYTLKWTSRHFLNLKRSALLAFATCLNAASLLIVKSAIRR